MVVQVTDDEDAMGNTNPTPSKTYQSQYNSSYTSQYSNRYNTNGQMGDEAIVQIERRRYKSRRQMAWVAMTSMLLVTALLIFWVTPERIHALETILSWFYMCMASTIGFYMGASAYAMVNTPFKR